MANSGALIKESMWRDKDFRSLPRMAQCTYQQLCAQKELDCAGILTLNMPLLVKGCGEFTEDELYADLKVLEERRFVFVDYDTFEVFVRAKMRSLEVWRSPNMLKSALKSARMVESAKIRVELAAELRRLRRALADEVANELDPSRTPPDGSPKGSETLPEGGTLPEGSSLDSVLVSVSPSVDGYVGEEPSPFCSKHPNDTEKNCFACGQARRTYPERKARFDDFQRAMENIRRQSAISACTRCDEFGDITFDDSVRKCDHQEAAHG